MLRTHILREVIGNGMFQFTRLRAPHTAGPLIYICLRSYI